jgi:glycosyltransferase involved in cell wall biosynthesis
MRPLAIAHVDSETAWRGGQQALLTLARALRERGHRQTIIAPQGSALAARAGAEGFEVAHRVPRAGDIVHAHSGHAHNRVLRATLGAPVKRVVTRHVAFAPRHPLLHRWKYGRTCDAIIAVSEAVRAALLRCGLPPERVTVIHTGVALPTEVRRTPHPGLVAGHLGAFTPEKGQALLIEVARALPQVRFVLGGEGPLLAALRAAAPPNVEFPGFVADTGVFFEQLDIFLMPSRSEAWGLAALEAMAHGVPVLASNIQGLAEIVEPGRSGWLAPPDAPAAWVRAIEALDPATLAACSAAARLRAAQFSIAHTAEQTEQLYARLLGLS